MMTQRFSFSFFQLLILMTLTMIMALPSSSHAQRRVHRRPALPPATTPIISESTSEIIKAKIQQQFRGFHILKVRKILKRRTGIQLQGKKLKKVILKASSARGYGTAQLLINGAPIGLPQIIPTHVEKLVFPVANLVYGPGVVGGDIGTVQIELQGKIFVKVVAANVSSNINRQTIRHFAVHQTLRGQQHLSLAQLIGHRHGLQNKSVKSLSLTISSARGRGSVIVMAHGQILAHLSAPQFSLTQQIQLPLGTNPHSVKIRTRGLITISHLSLGLVAGLGPSNRHLSADPYWID